MRISLNWLNDYVDISDLGADEVAKTLTDIGLEVEEIENLSKVKGPLVVGQIIKADKHPNADQLKVCEVDIGALQALKIVCGAPNARAGIKVAVATVGCVLPGDFKIKATKIRGETSEAMMCSAKELEISDDHQGIIELESAGKVGSSAGDVLKLNDKVLVLSITPNRADCLSYIGVARDLAAKLDRQLKKPELLQLESLNTFKTSDCVKVNIDNKDQCGRFCALYIKNVELAPSPFWLQKRLEASGIRAINYIVDITNYVMLEYGQPIHAYDERDVEQNTINVKSVKSNERFKTLDRQERELVNDDILIFDFKKPIGLAGIMGGENSEIKPDTKNIIVEVAHFDPVRIRKTARRLGLHTESSHRFERGIDINQLDCVVKRIAYLIQTLTHELKITRPEIASDLIDLYPYPVKPNKIAVRLERTRKLLGLTALSQNQITSSLESLELKLIDKNNDRMLFEIPTFRHDLTREVDLIEEVGRMIGLDNIPYTLPIMEIRPTPEHPMIKFIDDTKMALAQLGYTEIMSFPFLSADELNHLNLSSDHPYRLNLTLANALNEEQKYLTPTIIPELIKAVRQNRHHSLKSTRLFEVSRGYYDSSCQKIDTKKYPCWQVIAELPSFFSQKACSEKRPIEKPMISGIIDQPYVDKGWNTNYTDANFFHAKQTVEHFLKSFSIRDLDYKAIQKHEFPFLHPGRSALIYKKERFLGFIGELHPKTVFAYDLHGSESPLVFELDLTQIYHLESLPFAVETQVYPFPPATRDLAFVVDKTISHKDFVNAIEKFSQKRNLKNYRLFDVYQGDQVGKSKKSMAYAFSFRSVKRTLNDKEVEDEVKLLIDWLAKSLSAELRQ